MSNSTLLEIAKNAIEEELYGKSIIDKIDLESKFESWMTKENYGLWHVDHIKPCAKFDLTCEEQQRICFHYTNLQPLYGFQPCWHLPQPRMQSDCDPRYQL